MEHEEREILNHGLVGGLIAVVLVAFHEIADGIKELFHTGSYLPQAILLAITYFFVIYAILLVELYLRKLAWKARIRVGDLGFVDGQWIDVIVQDGEIKGAGVVQITSMAGEGFRMEGKTFEVDSSGMMTTGQPGTWNTIHGRLSVRNSVAYVYEGHTPRGGDHFGVGYYQFRRESGQATLHFEGGFLAKQENVAFHSLGRQMPAGSKQDDALLMLKAYIQDPQIISFAATHRRNVDLESTIPMDKLTPGIVVENGRAM